MLKILNNRLRMLMLTVMLASSANCFSQDYPNKPIRLLIPVPAGGGTDILARVMADHLVKQLGQPIVFDHKGGASGMIAVENMLQAPADGYTLLMVFSGVVTVNHSLYKNIRYDPIRDLVGIANFAEVPNLLIVHPSFTVQSVKELIARAKANPDSISYASSGNGVSNHLAMELFKQLAGISMVHIPHKGGAQAMVSLMGGQVQMMFNNAPEVLPQLNSGRLKVLAIATPERSPLMPEIPTVAEAGLPGFSISLWYGLVGAKGIPVPIIEKLNAAVRTALADPEVLAKLAKLGAQPLIQSTQQFADLIQSDSAKWAQVLAAGNIKAD
ncbi:MAG: tripartite tricarboxylate transporter substrate binding protein [Alcaligenaceae bacterium]|nr:tripartite tricarboxylate transporter substrate binding protein [Alcaligenaceae bacterium]